MLPYLLMIAGALLLIVAIVGLIAYFLAPFYKTIRVVLYGEDDYLHFTSPGNYAFLQKEKRNFLRLVAIFGILGAVLLFSGIFMRFGSRGLKMMFALNTESPEQGSFSEIEGIDQFGDYTNPETEKTYKSYFVVKGDQIYYRSKLIGGTDKVSDYLEAHASELGGSLCIVDDYASSAAFHALMNLLYEKGYDYEVAAA